MINISLLLLCTLYVCIPYCQSLQLLCPLWMAVPSVTNAQVQVSVIQMQWSPEAGAKGTFDQADHTS
jgi:hypothetical protein